MKKVNKWVIITALFFAAIASYNYGFEEGIFIFIALGIVLESAFWFEILVKKKHKNNSIN